MNERRARSAVGTQAAGLRLDRWLADRFTYHARHQWQRLVRDGQVLVNGQFAKPATTLHADDVVEYRPADLVEPEIDAGYELLTADDTLLAIAKPGNLPVHPAGRYFHHTLWYLLATDYPQLHFVHRLDRETSGVVLAARTKVAARALGAQLADRSAHKTYLLLVHGEFPREVQACGYLEPDPDSPVRKKQRFLGGQAAGDRYVLTRFTRLACGQGLSLLAARPETGRLHQIRATLCSLGFPVVGDKLYGLDATWYLDFAHDRLAPDALRRLLMPRQALHAWRLEFRHPGDGKRRLVEAPLPADFRQCLEAHDLPLPRHRPIPSRS